MIDQGKDILLKLFGEASCDTVAGLCVKRFILNGSRLDLHDEDAAAKAAEILQRGGKISLSISGHGIFKDGFSYLAVLSIFFSAEIRKWQLWIPDLGAVDGEFQVIALEYAGQYANETMVSLSLESVGEMVFGAFE